MKRQYWLLMTNIPLTRSNAVIELHYTFKGPRYHLLRLSRIYQQLGTYLHFNLHVLIR